MTMQIRDKFFVEKTEYSLVRAKPGGLFDPSDYGFKPKGIITACYSGYWCVFSVHSNRLFLQELNIHDEDNHYPSINGVSFAPTEYTEALTHRNGVWIEHDIDKNFGHKAYKGLALPLDYSGALLIGKDMIPDYYFYCHHPCAYQEVLRLDFEKGEQTQIIDLSEAMVLQRQQVENNGEYSFSFLRSKEKMLAPLPEEYKKELDIFFQPRRGIPASRRLRDFLKDFDAKGEMDKSEQTTNNPSNIE